MAKIAYILLCHRNPKGVVEQAERLTAAGDRMAIHFDARSPAADYRAIRAALADNPNVVFARRRYKCGWGEWSLVAATLAAIRAAYDAFPDATHFYMLSGDCMAIKTAEYAHAYLDARNTDFIENVDFFEGGWIKTGIREERLIYRHPFNERTRKRLFYASLALQRRLGLTRQVPADLTIRIGSQWWCLRRRTVGAVLDFVRRRPDVVRFFRTTWIPDETFFQTLVPHLVPVSEIESRTLTFLMFSDYGMPVTFYNDHYDLLMGQEALFARKISPEARELKARLGDLYQSTGVAFGLSNEGRNVYSFLTSRGRIGQRFAPRFWEREATIGRDRELMVIACKKWHVARRLVDTMSFVTNLPAVEYLFDDEGTALPELGGIEASLEKRSRHRRALLRLLYDYFGSDRLAICLDPSNFDLLRDVYADRCRTKLLEIECAFSDDYLTGHAMRVGLAGEHTSAETLGALLPAIRNDFAMESDRIRDAGFDDHWIMREGASAEENAAPLASFLSIPEDKARQIAATQHLFAD